MALTVTFGASAFASVFVKLFNAAFAAEYAITPSRPLSNRPRTDEMFTMLPLHLWTRSRSPFVTTTALKKLASNWLRQSLMLNESMEVGSVRPALFISRSTLGTVSDTTRQHSAAARSPDRSPGMKIDLLEY